MSIRHFSARAGVRAGTAAVALAGVCALVAPMVAGARGSASHAKTLAGTITSVAFVGSPTHPTVIVRGRGLGTLPPRDPAYRPARRPLCGLKTRGNAGYDYGVNLYLVDESARPVWTAGRYQPQRGELDCIGVIVTSFSASRVTFRLGSAYTQYKYPRLRVGSSVHGDVNGAFFRTKVKYTPRRRPSAGK